MTDTEVTVTGLVATGPAPNIAGPQPGPPQPGSPERVTQLLQLAAEHEAAGRLDEAETALRHVLEEVGDHHGALHQMGIITFKRGNVDGATRMIERAIAMAPTVALYHRNICEMYRVLGRLDEALAAGRRAAALTPNDPLCHHNLSVLHYHRLELDDAIAAAERALALQPDFPGAHFGIAEAALLRGDLERGWEAYEWRFKLATAPSLMPPTNKPQWDGRPLPEGRLLLIADQGYGDVIQFARYIPWAAARAPWPAIACSGELQPVLSQMPGAGRVFDHWDHAPEFDAYCALSGLPRLAGTRVNNIPAPIPYVRPDDRRFAHWAERLWAWLPPSYRRIGLVWAGRPTHQNDRNRSISLATLGPVLQLPNIAFVTLQKGPGQAQVGQYWGSAPLFNLGPELNDYGDTMAVIECLERIITVDTSVAHLAGAMGKDVWLLLPYAPDWRWLLDRSDSPWYPTIRLFRQGPDRRWGPVIERVAAELSGQL